MKKLLQLSSLLMLTFGLNACLSDIDEDTKRCKAAIEVMKNQNINIYSFVKIKDARNACDNAAKTADGHVAKDEYLFLAYNAYLMSEREEESVNTCKKLVSLSKKYPSLQRPSLGPCDMKSIKTNIKEMKRKMYSDF
jgi:hypothetical protein